MEILAVFDAKDYQDTVEVFEKYSVRGIILRDGKLAMQRGRDGTYKLPGGGQEEGEDFGQTLVREVGEETGLRVIERSIRELGEILEIRRDLFEPCKKYICHSLFYFCLVEPGQDALSLTPSEAAKGYELSWATPEEVCRENGEKATEPWILRDTAFVRMIAEGRVALPDGRAG